MKLAVVVIGRNEGERLRRSLIALQHENVPTVYVDSGSSDNSVELARSFGAEIVELDAAHPFTAARARNAGWQRVVEIMPDVDAVQFLDGDCEVMPGWLDTARDYLKNHRECVAVCGHRRERYPRATIYNRLCDIELDTPAGVTDSSGGDVCIRLANLQEIDGYRDAMIAGEEPELCFRLRQSGGQIMQLEREMSVHDADMKTIGQWWRRAVRTGHAYAEVNFLTRSHPTGLWRQHQPSIVFWSVVLPALAIGLAWTTRGWSLLLLTAYVVLFARIALHNFKRLEVCSALWFAFFCVIAKFAHLLGMLRFHWNRWMHRESHLIEYKVVANSTSGRPS